uniref:proline dehydrogenase 1, mitochondrial-like n=1 Tax=Callithrix jacchus TaxID=9483 RepID=UPI0023DD4D64|nr:proline dehydrogenase 1, mitochondrial-like [Callithrix jacchus]
MGLIQAFSLLKESIAKMGITSRAEIEDWFTAETLGVSGTVDLLDWSSLIDSRTKLCKHLVVPNTQTGQLEPLLSRFTEEEELQMTRMLQRMDVLAKKATEVGVRLMVDAEQTYFQPAISRLTLEMQRRFNVERPLIFSTHQCYLKFGSRPASACLPGGLEAGHRRGSSQLSSMVFAWFHAEHLPGSLWDGGESGLCPRGANQPRVFNEQEEDSNLYEDPLDVPDTPNLEGFTLALAPQDAYDNVTLDVELARREGWCFGSKLVWGAYMAQERARSAEIGYQDPINPTYEATNTMYHRCLDHVLEEVKHNARAKVMVATHNEDSVRFTLRRMEELCLHPAGHQVYFGQLLGMCDQISLPLGQAGYPVYRYVPYGPVMDVLPYLSRLALENSSLKGARRERQLLWLELLRRLQTGSFFHRPA